MSAKSFLVMGDQVVFLPAMQGGGVLVAPAMTVVKSKSKNTASFRGVTVEGDEAEWIVPVCPYINPPYVIPGTVMCKIKKLDNSNIAPKILEKGKKVLLVGSAPFIAEFKVLSPALQPPKAPVDPPTPDSTPMYEGKGQFIQALDSKALNQ